MNYFISTPFYFGLDREAVPVIQSASTLAFCQCESTSSEERIVRRPSWLHLAGCLFSWKSYRNLKLDIEFHGSV